MKVNLQQARSPPLTSELDLLDLRYTGSASTPTLIRVATAYKDPQSYTGKQHKFVAVCTVTSV